MERKMTKRLLGAAVIVGLSATSLLAQTLPEPASPRPKEREPLYATVKVDPGLRPYKPVGALSGQIRGMPRNVMILVTRALADGFKKVYPNVEFDVTVQSQQVGLAGLASLQPGSADFVTAGRELLPIDISRFREEQRVAYDPLAIAVTGGTYRTMGFTDAVTFFVNKNNPLDKISLAQLDAIYSSTRNRGYKEEIKTWGELGLTGEWADKPVIPWSVKAPQGFDSWLRQVVLKDGKVKAGIEARDMVFPMPYLVGFSRYSIGYAGFSYVDCANNIKQLAIAENDGGPYYKGTFDEVLAQKYPLSRVIYFFAHRVPGTPLNPLLKEFLKFVLSRDGQQLVVNDGVYLPLSPWLVERERAKLE
jgi:phosphate transport system substrate-binding protein